LRTVNRTLNHGTGALPGSAPARVFRLRVHAPMKISTVLAVFFYALCILFFSAVLIALLWAGSDPARFVSGLFRFICHQGDTLSCFGLALSLPLCARCLAMYFSMAAGAMVYDLILGSRKVNLSFVLLLAGVAPMIADGFFRISAGLGWPALAVITGALFGFTVGLFTLQGIRSFSR
jgi:uncharacterized membrane protein